jgi:hypothetical protein
MSRIPNTAKNISNKLCTQADLQIHSFIPPGAIETGRFGLELFAILDNLPLVPGLRAVVHHVVAQAVEAGVRRPHLLNLLLLLTEKYC